MFDQCVAPSGIINYQNRIAVKTQLPSKLKFFASLLILQRKASITRLTKKKEKIPFYFHSIRKSYAG